jgi:hypothetical protein
MAFRKTQLLKERAESQAALLEAEKGDPIGPSTAAAAASTSLFVPQPVARKPSQPQAKQPKRAGAAAAAAATTTAAAVSAAPSMIKKPSASDELQQQPAVSQELGVQLLLHIVYRKPLLKLFKFYSGKAPSATKHKSFEELKRAASLSLADTLRLATDLGLVSGSGGGAVVSKESIQTLYRAVLGRAKGVESLTFGMH